MKALPIVVLVGSLAITVFAFQRTTRPVQTLDSRMQNGERWPVKVGADADASQVNATPVAMKVAALRQAPIPEGINPTGNVKPFYRTHRAGDLEKKVVTIDADLLRVHPESDGDYHIVIVDHGTPDTNSMIAEIPNPEFVPNHSAQWGTSPFFAKIKATRDYFSTQVMPLVHRVRNRERVHVKITGVVMFDFIHPTPQDGVAPNAIELHPVLDVRLATGG